MIDMLIPFYIKEGKYSLNICIGCTGGHHRSVAVANELHRRLQESGKRTTLELEIYNITGLSDYCRGGF